MTAYCHFYFVEKCYYFIKYTHFTWVDNLKINNSNYMESTINHDLIDKFELWKKASLAYYNDDTIMSDQEFDELQDYLLENGTSDIIHFLESNIVREWGFEDISLFKELEEKEAGKQLSLKKIKWQSFASTFSDIFLFFNNIQNGEYFISPKLDGCSVKIDMITGVITTRGGHNITDKLKNNSSVNDAIEKYPHCIYIVGEMVIGKQIFNKFYSSEFANPRNFVSGVINSKEPDENALQDLMFIPCTDGTNPLIDNNYWQQIQLNRGFFAAFDMEKYYDHLKSDIYPFLCDGVVISTSVKERKIKDNYPLNMVAVKFPSPKVTSKVIGFEWEQKKSKRITPVVLIDPVNLDGSVISKCSGYNYQYLIDNKIGIGSEVVITKSGDIIPIIIQTITKSDIITMPNIGCTHIGKHLIVDDDFDTSNITKFRNAFRKLDIKNIGEVTCGIIGEVCNNDIVEMFNPQLKIKFLTKLGSDSANYKNFKKIYEIKTLFLSDLIYMLQFDNVGEVLSKRLADIMTKRDKDTSGISKEVLINVAAGNGFKKIQNSINILKSYGVSIILEPIQSADSITIEMTGEPPSGTKEQWLQSIRQNYPNVIHLPLTKNTNYLITNDINSNTTKMNKARKYNVKIATYNDFITILKNQ